MSMSPETISSIAAISSGIAATVSALLAMFTFRSLRKHKEKDDVRVIANFHYQMLCSRVEAVSNDLDLLKYYDVNSEEIDTINLDKDGFLHILQRHVYGYYRYYVEDVRDEFADHIMEKNELKVWWPIQRKIISGSEYVDYLDKVYTKFHGETSSDV